MPLWIWPVILSVIVYPTILLSWLLISKIFFHYQVDYILAFSNIFGVGTFGMVIGFILYLLLEWNRDPSE